MPPDRLPDDFGPGCPCPECPLQDAGSDLLIHCCCAPCSTAVFECLRRWGCRPLLLFYNPNIWPDDEYRRRRDVWVRLAALCDLPYIIGDPDHAAWAAAHAAWADAPERGARCLSCFTCRLTVAARTATAHGRRYFTTTLATSRWKSKAQVDDAGRRAAAAVPGSSYWEFDWRKHGLGPRRDALVKKLQIYNQQYCGCEFSCRRTDGSLQPMATQDVTSAPISRPPT